MKRRAPRDYLELLRTGRWFAGLPDALQEGLIEGAHVRKVAAGTRVGRRGDTASGLYAVIDGSIRLAGVTERGRDVLHMFVEPPSWFGELSVIDGLPRTIAMTAEGDSELLHVSQRALEALLAADPRHWRHLAQLLAYRLRLAVLALEDAVAGPPIARLARRLVLMIEGYGDRAHRRRTIALSQQQLAMTLNVSRQTANQLLKELEARGLVRLAYGEIEIVDDGGLRELARAA